MGGLQKQACAAAAAAAATGVDVECLRDSRCTTGRACCRVARHACRALACSHGCPCAREFTACPACSSGPSTSPSFLPRNVAIIGYARTQLTDQQLRDKLRPRLTGSDKEKEDFLGRCTYVAGGWGGM